MGRVVSGLNVLAALLLVLLFVAPVLAAPVPNLTHLPLAFEPNVGQAPDDVRFFGRGLRYRLWLAGDEVRLASPPAPGHATDADYDIRLRWLGGSVAPAITAEDELPGKAHYYMGRDASQWRRNVPTFGRIVYRGVYPGVDLVFHGTQHDTEFDFVLEPGADPRLIRLELAGADSLVTSGGDLVATRGGTRVTLHEPRVYQDGAAGRVPVAGRFRVDGRSIAFEVGDYDRSLPLVIDPVVTYSTYLGASGSEIGRAIGTDGPGNMYVSLGYVAKLSADGFTLLYTATFGDATMSSIAVDSAGNAYLAGTWPQPRSGFQTTYPITSNALQPSPFAPAFQGDTAGVTAKLGPDGSLLYSSYVGGCCAGQAAGVAFDGSGNFYVVGHSNGGNMPTTRPAFGSGAPVSSGFIQVVAADYSHYVYSAWIFAENGSLVQPAAVAVDGAGSAYITGHYSPGVTGSGAFPTTPGAYQTTPPPSGTTAAAFLMKIAPGGSSQVYGTYFYGTGGLTVNGLAVDGGGNTYLAGFTTGGLPTVNALQPALAGGNDAFVAKFNATGSALVFSTYLGGSLDDTATSIGLDFSGNIYVAGPTDSTDFPQKDALPPAFGVAGSNFVTVLTPAADGFVYSTYFGDAQTTVVGMSTTSLGKVYLTGSTTSTAYPTLRPYQAGYGGGASDAFVARIEPTAAGTCGTGQFFAEYFANPTLTPPSARAQCEASINYDWGIGGPAGVPPDNFSARWTGNFNFTGGSVTFTARADDGVRVYLDGTVVIDGWVDQPATTYTATRTVAAGLHEVKVEYYEKTGDAVIQVGWTGSSGGSCQPGLFFTEYFSNTTLTAPATRTACEGAPNYTWGAGGPAGLPVDNFSARWTGSPTFSAGTYTFTARADDGVRVFVDGALLINGWVDQPATTYTATSTLTAGAHEVKIEYYEKTGDAVIQVSWALVGAAGPPVVGTLTPSSTTAGGPGFTLTVDGSAFVSGARVFFNGSAYATTFVSATRLTASITLDAIKSPGTVPVFVVNPDGQRSNVVNFSITPAGSSCPSGQFFAEYFSNMTLTAPSTRTACEASVNYDWGAGGPAGLPVDNFSARWTGSFPFANETVTFTARADDGVRLYLDGTLIIDGWKDQGATTYTATRAVTSGNHEIKVEYYEHGGAAVIQVAWGGSTTAPTLTTLTPSSATAGGPAFTLTADGTNFVTGATVLWNGSARTTTFVSTTRVTASIPASDIAAAGSVPVSVRNPDGQTSAAQTFTINAAGVGGTDTIKVFITAPANGSTVRGTVWFTVWLENAAAGNRTVTLSVNGTTITSTTTTSNGPISIPWSTTTADNGSRTATISVRDSANATGRASVTVTVAN